MVKTEDPVAHFDYMKDKFIHALAAHHSLLAHHHELKPEAEQFAALIILGIEELLKDAETPLNLMARSIAAMTIVDALGSAVKDMLGKLPPEVHE